MKGFSTAKQAAERLGVSTTRMRQLIFEGTIKAEKAGRDNFIPESEVKRLESLERKTGRPKKKNSVE